MLKTSRLAAVCLPALLLGLVACQSKETQAKLEQLATVSTERDRLMQEMADNARLMSQIGAELARVQVPSKQLHVSRESPMRAARDSVIQRIHYIATKVNDSETRLRENERRIRALTVLSDSLRATLDSTLANFQNMLESQKATIASLTEQVTQLAAANAALADTVNQLATKTNTVYYVVGTEDELIQRGIIRKEGGSRFLFVLWKSGQTLVPGRELDPSEFRTFNKRVVREIVLPDSTRPYRLASRRRVPLPTPHSESYFARSRYSPLRGSTRTVSPSLTKSGTCTITPLESLAGLVLAVLVALRITGEVSTTLSSITDGSSMPIGLPSSHSTWTCISGWSQSACSPTASLLSVNCS